MGLTRQQMLQAFLSGAQGENPFAQGQQQRLTQREVAAQKKALTEEMEGGLDENGQLRPGVAQQAKSAELAQQAKMEQQKLQNEMGMAQSAQQRMGQISPGKKFNVGVGPHGVTLQEAEQNVPLLLARMGPQQAQGALKAAGAAYKPINDQVQAAQATINYLDKGDQINDKLAWINEARLAAGQGGSRALKSIADILSGGKTAAMDWQSTLNYMQNTPNVSVMQPGQRDAMRGSVYGRLDDLNTLQDQTEQQLRQQGPLAFPMANTDSIVDTFAKPTKANLARLGQQAQSYKAQMQKSQQQLGTPPVSQPSTASPNPTTLQSLGNFFKGLTGARQQQDQAQQPPVAPSATNTSRGGTPLTPQNSPGNTGAGAPGAPATGTLRVKHRASGQTGTIPKNEYDPAVYEQVQ